MQTRMDSDSVVDKARVSSQSTGEKRTPMALDDQLSFLLRRSNQRVTGLFQQMMTVSQLTAPQYNALVRLREKGKVSQNQLGRMIDMDPATTQGVISRLVQRGYIQRVPDALDRRRVQLTLSDIGHQVLLEAMVVGRDIQEKALMGFSEEERTQLKRLLSKLAG